MRRLLALSVYAASLLAMLWSCSKKSAGPTAPPASNPVCSLSASSLNFGTVAIGSSADRQFTVTNTGTGTLSGTVTDTSAFFNLVGAASYSLGAGQAATFTVRFSPIGDGPASCSLSSGTACGAISCSATGQTATPVCTIIGAPVNFGSRPIGSTITESFDLGNSGSGTLVGTVTGASADYTVLNPQFSLRPGQHGPIVVAFHPSSTISPPCTLSVGSAGCAPVVCRGISFLETHDHCSVGVTSGVVDFGEVSVGHTAERSVTLKNSSMSYLARGGVEEYCTDFSSLIPAYTIDPNTSITGHVQFTPTTVGEQFCTMPINCWMDGSGTNPGVQGAITCRGVGVGGAPDCQLSTTSLDFGSVVVGQTKDLPLMVTNNGTGPLSGNAGPSHCPEFVFQGSTAYNLGPGQSTTLTLRFIPMQPGHTITCSLMPIGPDCPALNAVGEAVGPPACEVSTTDLEFGSVPVGQSRELTLDIRNTGGGTLCGSVTEAGADFSIVQNASYCITAPAFVRVTVRFTPSVVGPNVITISAGPGVSCPTIWARGTGS